MCHEFVAAFSSGPEYGYLKAGTTFSGYLQQQIGDNQWDKICILGWKGSGTSNKKQEQKTGTSS